MPVRLSSRTGQRTRTELQEREKNQQQRSWALVVQAAGYGGDGGDGGDGGGERGAMAEARLCLAMQTDGQTDRRTSGRRACCTERETGGQTDRQTDRQTDGRASERSKWQQRVCVLERLRQKASL